MKKTLFPLVVSAALVLANSAYSQEKNAEPEVLPPPKGAEPQEILPAPQIIEPPLILMIPRVDYPRPGKQSIWRVYAVDSTGERQPRVVYSPSGAYYQYNGAPYPWAATRPGQFSRFIVE